MSAFTDEQIEALRSALRTRPEVARALLVESPDRPTLVFEYDERPPRVPEAQADAVFDLGIAAGGPEDVAQFAAGAVLPYERAATE